MRSLLSAANMAAGHPEAAIRYLETALQSRPDYFDAHYNLGMALERSGHPAAAAKAYEAAIALDSTYRKASISLARITAGTPEPDSASVDLTALAQQFQSEIEGWRGSAESRDSTAVPAGTVTDSSKVGIVGLSDSSVASVEAVSDTSEDCEQE